MNVNVDATTTLSARKSVFDCEVGELKQLVNEYPYFAPAKFLLAKKMKEKNAFLYEEYIQRAAIYFQNPAWLEHMLQDRSANDHTEQALISNTEKIESFKTETEAEIPLTTPTDTEPSAPVVPKEAEIERQEVPGNFINDQDPVNDDVTELTEGEEQSEIGMQLPAFKFEPIDPAKPGLTFEPYHTVDYFASQGIKAREEEKTKDQFSRQLKSFTEWIRVMKKLPASEIAASVSPTEEKKVEKMAEVSIHDREVVTEAMAEVWEKQGNTHKALETYQKLSLLNPAKSAYFAAKIDHLKNL
jgi:hypothetical protein